MKDRDNYCWILKMGHSKMNAEQRIGRRLSDCCETEFLADLSYKLRLNINVYINMLTIRLTVGKLSKRTFAHRTAR